MLRINKVANSKQAFEYYKDRDDYYLSDKSSAMWHGRGAQRLGLAGAIDATDFKRLFSGQYGPAAVKNSDRHLPGWDATFSAPKSVSVAALVAGDSRLVEAHDRAVQAALDHLETWASVSRSRDGSGAYTYRRTGNLAVAVVRHSTSRNVDPQMHSHALIANATFDEASGKWTALDSRQGLFSGVIEAGNVYTSALANEVRRLGYAIEWRTLEDGAVTFEITSVPEAVREGFSSRRAEVLGELAARGIDAKSASRKQLETAALDTRSPKEHFTGKQLAERWKAQAQALGYVPSLPPKDAGKKASQRDESEAAAAAVRQAIDDLSEREARFTDREILAGARQFGKGEASDRALALAIDAEASAGRLIPTEHAQDGIGGERELVRAWTTAEAQATELEMLSAADALQAAGRGGERIGERVRGDTTTAKIDAAIAAQEAATGHRFTDEQRAAARAILAGDSGFHIVQGYAGTAKTSSVAVVTADYAKAGGWEVRALAPTHSAAGTLADAVGGKPGTIAAEIHATAKPDGSRESHSRRQLWMVDEAGMVGAADMRDLLKKAEREGARVVLMGDKKQIGSVQAGNAFEQLQATHAGAVHTLTSIKRQRADELKAAVVAAIDGDAKAALDRVTVREHASTRAAADGIADDYMTATRAGKTALVVTLSRADRAEVNSAIQARREAAGEVTEARTVNTLEGKQWTKAQLADASRYAAGQVVEAGRDFKGGPSRGELATVERVDGDRVVARRANGKEWTFSPATANGLAVADRAQTRVGVGDRIVTKGNVRALDESGKPARIKNGRELKVVAMGEHSMTATDRDGHAFKIDTERGARIDLAYGQTADQAQGRGVDVAIGWARSTQRRLATLQRLYVALSRARERAIVHTDNKSKLADQIKKHDGRSETALAAASSPAPEQGRGNGQAESRTTAEPKTAQGVQTRGEAQTSKETWRSALAEVGRDMAHAVRAAVAEHRDRAPLRKVDRETKEAMKAIDKATRARVKDAKFKRSRFTVDVNLEPVSVAIHGSKRRVVGERGALNPVRILEAHRARVEGRKAKERVKGRQVMAHARWEQQRGIESGRSGWADPKASKLYVRSRDGRAAVSMDHGKTWRERGGVMGFADRIDAARKADRARKIEAATEAWRRGGRHETSDSRDLARRALETAADDAARLVKPERDWDKLAAKHGIEIDGQGHRYARDGHGGLHSETLTKRAAAIESTQRARQVARDETAQAARPLAGMLARHRIEKAVADARRAELSRLDRMASRDRSAAPVASSKPAHGGGAEPKTAKPAARGHGRGLVG